MQDHNIVAYDELLKALKDDEIDIIGLHGMGRCGKTTLVKQVGEEVKSTFNKVAFADMSISANVHKIQAQLASYLDLSLEGINLKMERARVLSERLSSGGKILIILDDVWETQDLDDIRIPFRGYDIGCKILLTTRRLEVCFLVGCEIVIPLYSILNEEEAWTLFRNHFGEGYETSDIRRVGLAQRIVEACKGLPIAIAAVASSLKGKSTSELEEALRRLRKEGTRDLYGGASDPHTCLQVCYDYLNNEEARSLFLLCSVFPEDFEISEEYLAIYGIGLGLFGEVSSYATARNKVYEAKTKLVDSCLLLKGDKVEHVRMHVFVRDVALFIAKKKKNVIMEVDSSWRNTTLEDNPTLRYLWYFKTHESDNLSFLLGCPDLEFLCLKILKHSALEDEVFKTMKHLRVLIIQGEKDHLLMLKCIQLLTNLRCLVLERLKLGDISSIGSLKRLESLVLESCSFGELPNETRELSELRLLSLTDCEIERNPCEVIRSCSQLQELFFSFNRGDGWEEKVELAIMANSDLQRYCIGTPRFHGAGNKFSITRGLSLNNFDAVTSNAAAIQDLTRRAEYLQLWGAKNGCKNIIPDVVDAIGVDMIELTGLELWNCDNIECLIDTRNSQSNNMIILISNLVALYFKCCNCLETVCRGPILSKLNLFSSLKKLFLYSCPMLTSVFTWAVAQNLEELEELSIQTCPVLNHIVVKDEEENDVKQHSALVFPRLRSLHVSDCNLLGYLIPASFSGGPAQSETMTISSDANLIKVSDQPSSTTPQEQQLSSNMQDSQINEPALVSQRMQNTESVCISGFQKVEDNSQLSLRPTSSGDPQPFTNCSKYFNSYDSNVLSYMKGPRKSLSPLNIKVVRIYNCPTLRCIWSATICESLPHLEELDIRDCPKLEQIIEGTHTPEVLNHTETDEVNDCSEEFPSAPEKPEISKCPSLFNWFSKPVNPLKFKKERKREKSMGGNSSR